MEAWYYKIAPKTFRRFVDDSHARFQERSHANKFLEILNKQDPAIKYTVEFEDHKHSLNFLDINSTSNTTNKKYEFKVNQKDAITNINIKPNSCIDPSITKSVFKGFVPSNPHNMFRKICQGGNTLFSRHVCRECRRATRYFSRQGRFREIRALR